MKSKYPAPVVKIEITLIGKCSKCGKEHTKKKEYPGIPPKGGALWIEMRNELLDLGWEMSGDPTYCEDGICPDCQNENEE